MSQPLLNALHRETRDRLRFYAEGVTTGYRTPAEFGDAVDELLVEMHTRAVVIGRQHAGDAAPEEADDRAFAEQIADEQAEFLAGFVRDLEAGRYDDAPGPMLLRAESYANRLAATANEAFALASGGEALFRWILGATETKHCDSCPTRARQGPYTADELAEIGYPASGSTRCRQACRCRIERADGLAGYQVPEEVAS